MTRPLTAKAVENVKPEVARYEVSDIRVPGLFLVVQPSGAKSWAFRYRYLRKPKKLTIGPSLAERKEERVPFLGEAHTLAEARAAAESAAVMLAEGNDPTALRRAESEADRAKTDTVQFAINEFLERHVMVVNRPKTQVGVRAILQREVAGAWGDRKLRGITAKDVRALVRDVSTATLEGGKKRGGPGAARSCYAVLSKFFGWCVHEGMLAVSPIVGTKAPPALTSRDRVLTDNEVWLVWQASGLVLSPFGEMFRVLLLTGQRRDEVAQMRWTELDLEAALWLLPAQRSKNGRPHAVALSEEAVTIIQNLPRVAHPATGKLSDYVFTTTGYSGVSGYSKAKARLDQVIEKVAAPSAYQTTAWRLHDLRRTVASGMARLGQPIHIVEAVLNHRSGTISGIAAVYIRHEFADEKRRALEAWADFVKRIVTDNEVNLEAKGSFT